MSLELDRRGFLLGLGTTLVAAPAIVRITSLMPVRGIIQPIYGRSPAMVALPELKELNALRMAWLIEWSETAGLVTFKPIPPEELYA